MTSSLYRMKRVAHTLMLIMAATVAAPSLAADGQVLRLGHGIAAEHPLGQGALRFADILDQKTGGQLKVRVYPATQLGSEQQMVAAVRGGVQDMVITSTAPVAGMVKEYLLFDLPLLVGDEREADALLDGPVGQELLALAETRDMVGLCYWENGFRQVTNSKREVRGIDDIQGLKLRVMQNPVYLDAFGALGANAVPMPFTELYTAMESRAIDAQENPIAIIHSNKFYEVQKYVTLTNHAYAPYVVLFSKKRWDAMDDGQRTALREACHEARDFQRDLSRKLTAQLVDELGQRGMTVTRLAPEEVEKMRARLQPVIERYTQEVGPALAARAQDQLSDLRAR